MLLRAWRLLAATRPLVLASCFALFRAISCQRANLDFSTGFSSPVLRSSTLLPRCTLRGAWPLP
jgi:hypothetical protein